MPPEKERVFPGTTMPDADWWAQLWPHPQKILEKLGIGPGAVVADLCCGNGYFTIPLAQLTGSKTYGIDLDEALLEEARKVAHGKCSIQWIYGDARDVEKLLPEKVDCILMANTFHGVSDKTSLALHIAAALRENGSFIVINWHALPREKTVILGEPRGPRTEVRMSPELLCAMVEPAGFMQEKVLELPPYHYGSVFRKHS